MKRTGSMRPDWIDDAGKMVGIYMGADFTSEHEWGIKGIQKQLGLNDGLYGIERRRIRNQQINLITLGPKIGSYLYLESGVTTQNFKNSSSFRETQLYGDDATLSTAWDERSFCIHVRGKENVEKLKDLHAAANSEDAAIWIGKLSNNPFENAGLILCIVSRVDPKHLNRMEEADRDHERLLQAAEKTGIADRLKKAGKVWFALSPAWADDAKTQVRFWLNPYRQDLYESNWYSVEDLDLWAKDQGPVLKKVSKK